MENNTHLAVTIETRVKCRIRPSTWLYFNVWGGSPHLLVTPVQLMRPGIGQNVFCTLGDFAKDLGLPSFRERCGSLIVHARWKSLAIAWIFFTFHSLYTYIPYCLPHRAKDYFSGAWRPQSGVPILGDSWNVHSGCVYYLPTDSLQGPEVRRSSSRATVADWICLLSTEQHHCYVSCWYPMDERQCEWSLHHIRY